MADTWKQKENIYGMLYLTVKDLHFLDYYTACIVCYNLELHMEASRSARIGLLDADAHSQGVKCFFNIHKCSNGYANEVGEAFRALVSPIWVHASYGVASLYVLADTFDKAKKADRKERQKPNYSQWRVAGAAADTLIWQALASVIIPGFTINRICALTQYSLSRFSKLPPNTRKWTTTAVGLGSIPFIVHPIDTLVHFLLDKTLRRFIGN